MAVLGATRAYKDWRVANGLSEEQEVDKDGQTDDLPTFQNLPDGELADDYADDDLKALEDEDPLTLIDSLSTRVGSPLTSGVASSAFPSLPLPLLLLTASFAVFRLDDYIPDKFRPQYDTYKKTLVDVLIRAGIIYPPVLAENADRPELTRARTAHSQLVDDIGHKQRGLVETREALAKDWGRDWEWKKLDGETIELNTGE